MTHTARSAVSDAVILRYPLPAAQEFTLLMPVDAQILQVATNGGEPNLWALGNPNSGLAARRFCIFADHQVIVGELLVLIDYVASFWTGGMSRFHLFAWREEHSLGGQAHGSQGTD